MDNLTNEQKKYFYNFGYFIFGPLLLSFSKWLKAEVERNNISKVYFLARDGYVIKRAFDIINDNSSIRSSYFYASRRAIIVPSLWNITNKEEIFKKIAFNKNITIKNFIKKVGLEDINLSLYLKKYNLELTKTINLENLDEKFCDFLNEILPIIKKNSKKEWKNFRNYIEKEKFFGKAAIVDIGWFGSMQKAIEDLLEDTQIYGYYFGLVPNKKISGNNSFGFLFDTNKNEDLYNKFHYFINVFEFIFLAQHGSTKKYINSKEFVKLYEYEYENKIESNIAKLIQDSAVLYVKDNLNNNVSRKLCEENLIKIFLRPNKKDSINFGNISFNDDEIKIIAKPKCILHYLFNLKKLKKDFIESSWRIGFLKRLLVIPLPYYKINEILRKIFLKEGM